MKVAIVDVKHCLCDKNFYFILAPSVFNPTPERLLGRAEKYQKNEKTKVYAYLDDKEYKGIIVFEIKDKVATILDIAVKPEYQGKGIGSKLIDYIFNQFSANKIIAETDDDAVEFYKKYGFVVTNTKLEFGTKRYVVIKEQI